MAPLGKLFDVDPDAGEDGTVVWAKYRKRAPSCDPEADQKPAKKQKTEKISYVATAVAEEQTYLSELVQKMNNNGTTTSMEALLFLLYRSVLFVSGGLQCQEDVEASHSRPAGGKVDRGESEELGDWEEHTRGVGTKILLRMGFRPGKGLGKLLQGRSTILTKHHVNQGISGKVCRYSSSDTCRYGIRCKDFHLKATVKASNVAQGQEVCRFFSSTGLCWYGDRCYFSHVKTKDTDWECEHCGFDNEYLWSKYCQECGQFLTQFKLERN